VNGPVIKLGHSISTDRGQTRTFTCESPRPVFPVRAGSIERRSRNSSHRHSFILTFSPARVGSAGLS
jgi:hypothetical protein